MSVRSRTHWYLLGVFIGQIRSRARVGSARTAGRDLEERAQEVMSIPSAAAVMTPKVAQLKYLRSGEFTDLPMTLGLLVRRMTSRIRGGARRPLITADQNSIHTGEVQGQAQSHGNGHYRVKAPHSSWLVGAIQSVAYP